MGPEPPGPGEGAAATQVDARGRLQENSTPIKRSQASPASSSMSATTAQRVAPATAAGTAAAATSPALGAALRLGREFAASGAAVGALKVPRALKRFARCRHSMVA